VQELRFGDNDTLSAQVATLVEADYLFLMTDVDALYTANPKVRPPILTVIMQLERVISALPYLAKPPFLCVLQPAHDDGGIPLQQHFLAPAVEHQWHICTLSQGGMDDIDTRHSFPGMPLFWPLALWHHSCGSAQATGTAGSSDFWLLVLC